MADRKLAVYVELKTIASIFFFQNREKSDTLIAVVVKITVVRNVTPYIVADDSQHRETAESLFCVKETHLLYMQSNKIHKVSK